MNDQLEVQGSAGWRPLDDWPNWNVPWPTTKGLLDQWLEMYYRPMALLLDLYLI
jgi:hypothetical protein